MEYRLVFGQPITTLKNFFFLTVLFTKQGLNLRMYKTKYKTTFPLSSDFVRSITANRWHMKTFPTNKQNIRRHFHFHPTS
jgi:hypothetical protein